MNTHELSSAHPDAYKDLPEPYQADDCLTFWVDVNGNLCVAPKYEDVSILGCWEAMWVAGKGWIQL